MSRKKYPDELRKKIILEVLREESTIAEIASKYEVHPISIRDWKKQFLENMDLAINPKKGLKVYKEKIAQQEKEKDELYKQLGKTTTLLEWAKKKSREVGLID